MVVDVSRHTGRVRPVPTRAPRARLPRVRRFWLAHRASAVVLAPLLVIAGLAQGFNMERFPVHIDDEGTYVAQAYAVQHYHTLSHYTYWYDHPPLGWMQMALYTWTTDAFGRYHSAIDAGREFMLVIDLVSCVLLWVLCRRLHLARWACALAVALFTLSPLALQYHRTVYLDNIATPWLIAAFALALTPQKRLSAFVGSALCMAVAVLSKETSLLLVPALAVLLWRGTRNSGSRRYALTLAGLTFTIASGSYGLYAIVKGELLPGADHTSLWDGVKFQLFSRMPSGSIFADGTLSNAHLREWLSLDAVFPATAVLATVIGLFMHRMRPIAIGFGVLLLIMLKPGYLPVPYVIAMLPLAAVLVAGVADVAVSWRPKRWKTRLGSSRSRRVNPLVPAVLVAAAVFVVVAAPLWTGKFRAVFESDPNASIAASETWIERNVPKTDRMAVDDAYWLDLVRDGYPRDNVVWYYKIDTDPAVERLSPDGWRDYQYLVLTQSVRSDPQGLHSLQQAISSSVTVADFGTGDQEVQIRRVLPQGVGGLAAARKADAADRVVAGKDLLGNARVHADSPARGVLARGRLDTRAATVLAALSGNGPVSVSGLTADPVESAAGVPVHTMTITGPTLRTIRSVLASLPAGDQGASTTRRPDGSVVVTWPIDPVPTGFTY